MPEIFDASKSSAANSGNVVPITSAPVPSSSPRHKRSPKEYSEVMKTYAATNNPFASFMVRPPNVHMSIQEKDEKVLLLLRRHFITNTGLIVIILLMIMGPIITQFIPFINFLPDRFISMTALLWYLLTLGIALNGFLSWYFNVYIITDERIIDVDFLNLIYKNVSFAKLDKVEDISVETTGAIRNMLDFGTILIQTAAEKNQFDFEDVPHPQQVAKLLNELILEEEKEALEGRAN